MHTETLINFTSGRSFSKVELGNMGYNSSARFSKRARLESQMQSELWYRYASVIPQGIDFDTWRYHNRREAAECDIAAAKAVIRNRRIRAAIARLSAKDVALPFHAHIRAGADRHYNETY